MLRTAVEQLQAFEKTGIDATISVNIAARHLGDAGFVAEIERLFHAFGPATLARLELEVLESYPLANLAGAIDIMKKCGDYGVCFAIDDFGTGYSSLTYVKQLPTNTLKIDQSFVRDLPHSDEDMGIVAGIVEIASIFNSYIIAEGVETADQARCLQSVGCEYAQGYYYARPMAVADAQSWWQTAIQGGSGSPDGENSGAGPGDTGPL